MRRLPTGSRSCRRWPLNWPPSAGPERVDAGLEREAPGLGFEAAALERGAADLGHEAAGLELGAAGIVRGATSRVL